jgi:TetR/AcrR family transcriptional regulator, transcriptional repressor for nem operon
VAEARIREGGYAGFSFREPATELGVKSASVHHHFRTKAKMAAAVARRCAQGFLQSVAGAPDAANDDSVSIYRSAFRTALARKGKMHLRDVLGAEAGAPSREVAEEIQSFFHRCIDDLSRRIGGHAAESQSFHVMAAQEGGMVLARAYHSVDPFDHAVTGLA